MFVYGCRHATCSIAIWRMFSFTSFIIGSTHRPSTSFHRYRCRNYGVTKYWSTTIKLLTLPARLLKATLRAICSASVSYFLCISNYSCQRNCLKICRSDVHQIFRVGGTMAADDKFEFSFWCLKATIFLVFAQN